MCWARSTIHDPWAIWSGGRSSELLARTTSRTSIKAECTFLSLSLSIYLSHGETTAVKTASKLILLNKIGCRIRSLVVGLASVAATKLNLQKWIKKKQQQKENHFSFRESENAARSPRSTNCCGKRCKSDSIIIRRRRRRSGSSSRPATD